MYGSLTHNSVILIFGNIPLIPIRLPIYTKGLFQLYPLLYYCQTNQVFNACMKIVFQKRFSITIHYYVDYKKEKAE